MKLVPAIWTAALLAVACASAPPPAVGPVEVRDDAPYPDDDMDGVARGDVCAAASRRLWQCGCIEVRKVPHWMSFPAYCREMGPAIDTACIAANRTCGELVKCHVRCGHS